MHLRLRGKTAGAMVAACAIALSATSAAAAEKFVYATYFSDVYSASKTDLWFMGEIEKSSG